MTNYQRILIPMNLALGNGVLTPAVRRLITIEEAEITLLHVVESQPWLGRQGHAARLMSELELFAHRQLRGARITRRIEWGRPADCIVRTVVATGADVMLISAGPPSTNPAEPGAIVAEVLADSPCPVLIEWPVSPPVNRARVQPVCCAIEFDGTEEDVLGEALRAAERIQAPLILVGAVVPKGARSAILWDLDERARATAALQARVAEFAGRWAPDAEAHVGVGMTASVVSRALRLYGAGLLVTGGGPDAPMAAESECPVLYVGALTRQRAEHSRAPGRPLAAHRRSA